MGGVAGLVMFDIYLFFCLLAVVACAGAVREVVWLAAFDRVGDPVRLMGYVFAGAWAVYSCHRVLNANDKDPR